MAPTPFIKKMTPKQFEGFDVKPPSDPDEPKQQSAAAYSEGPINPREIDITKDDSDKARRKRFVECMTFEHRPCFIGHLSTTDEWVFF